MQKFLMDRLDKQTDSVGEIHPPITHSLSNYDKVPPRIFWYMTILVQEMYNYILEKNPEITRVSDDTLLEQLQGYATRENVHSGAIFSALLEAA